MRKFFKHILAALHMLTADVKHTVQFAISITGKILEFLMENKTAQLTLDLLIPGAAKLIPGWELALSKAIKALTNTEKNIDILDQHVTGELTDIEGQLQAFLNTLHNMPPMMQKALIEKLAALFTQILTKEPDHTPVASLISTAIAKTKFPNEVEDPSL